MSNIEWLRNKGTQQRIFVDTLDTFRNSQGFYTRLDNAVNDMEEEQFDYLSNELEKQNFKDTVDVVLWLEC